MQQRIAIIGAGIAGLTLARTLKAVADVHLFEKASTVGGRMGTHRAGPFVFDHGTQYFTARSRVFREFLAPWVQQGVIAEWVGKVVTLERDHEATKRLWFEPHFVGVPTMQHWCEMLGEGLTISTDVEVSPLSERTERGWALGDSRGNSLGLFDWVISTAAPAQTWAILGTHLPGNTPLAAIRMQGCYALMVGLKHAADASWIGAKVHASPLSWISIDASKPGRDAARTTIVAHACNDWSDAHRDDPPAAVQALLLRELAAQTGVDCTKPSHTGLHYWPTALVEAPSKPGPYCDPAQKLAAVGDWAVTSRIEEVWYASRDLAESISKTL